MTSTTVETLDQTTLPPEQTAPDRPDFSGVLEQTLPTAATAESGPEAIIARDVDPGLARSVGAPLLRRLSLEQQLLDKFGPETLADITKPPALNHPASKNWSMF